MGDQAAAGVSEDSPDDHVYMMLWILDFFGVFGYAVSVFVRCLKLREVSLHA